MSTKDDWNASFLDLLRAKKVSRVCPACQSDKVGFMEMTELAVPSEVVRVNKAASPSIPVLTTVCGNCGHLQFFSAKMLNDPVNG